MKRALLLFTFLIFLCGTAFSVERPEEALPDINLATRLGDKIDLSLQFTDSDGRKAALKDFVLENRPVLLVPVYYECPRLCGLVLNGVSKLLNSLNLKLGSDISVLTVSFDSTEGVELANKRAAKYRNLLVSNAGDTKAWHFLVGEQSQIAALTSQIGFKFTRDQDEFVHTGAVMLLTPQGEISQYFAGIEFPAWDVRLALVEASKGFIGSPIDHVFLFCFRFDPLKGKYTWAVTGLLRVGGAITLALLGYLVIGLVRKERKERHYLKV